MASPGFEPETFSLYGSFKIHEDPHWSVVYVDGIVQNGRPKIDDDLGDVPLGTWDGTERSRTSRSVPRLMHLKRIESTVPRDEFWVNFCSASPPWNDSFQIRGTQNYNICISFFVLLVSNRGHLYSLSVLSRPIPFCPVPSAYQTIPQ
ncbi:hypothetical protein DVH24_024709 [Malus domestica]|uniref:Uncharacterized protein n=1 Tax=Malus domestica TaxID=3750 RepID=A0A498JJ49_MALDO|nr:hypothetical protein DVH24_024709 [Malus domestica]